MKNFESLLADESFQRLLSDSASPEEIKKWEEWKNSGSDNARLYAQALDIWRAAQFKPGKQPHIDSEWRRLEKRLFMNNSAVKNYPREQRTNSYHRKRNGWLRGVAFAGAVALLTIVFYGSFRLLKSNGPELTESLVLSTEFGQRATLNLPEGTKIILNANSTLWYPATWTKKTLRRFQLVGEAYFDVASLQNVPNREFIVHTEDGTIQVVGTRFAVYERGNGTRVAVEKGGVEVASEDTRVAKPDSIAKMLLKMGQLVRFNRGQNLSPEFINVDPYLTWWRDQIILEKTPFNEIVQRLEETYGVTVKVKQKHLLERTLSGSIENQNLVVVTDALAGALNVSVDRKGQVIIFGD